MDYLERVFNEYLNAEGVIDIEGFTFDRDRILRELDDEGYKAAFESWLDQRKQDLLNKAQNILSLYDNETRFRRLKEIFGRRAVVPFVGAGLSISSGYPGWTSFLYKLLPETRITSAEMDSLINSGRYEEAAQRLHDSLPNGTFLESIENHFGCLLPLNGPVQKLPYLFPNMAITTNFDDVVERCYENADRAFKQTIIGADGMEVPRLIGSGERILIKLHGKANSSRHRILTLHEYESQYSNGKTLETVIETICNQTMLFLGCSLSVDRTLLALSSIMNRKGHELVPRHYAFLRLRSDEDRIERRDQLAASNIFPIWFPEEEDPDECVEALLTMLEDGIEE